MTLSLNIRGEMNTQKMSYTNAALRSADATCQIQFEIFMVQIRSLKFLLDKNHQTAANRHANTLIFGKRAI